MIINYISVSMAAY